ncbi:MAG: multiheme c-type cytochrome [Myxococcota bacterium]
MPGLASLSAASCGECHPDHYADWRRSTHAHAWVDPQLQAEMTKSENRWMCQNCHTPLMIQQPRWPVGLADGDVERPTWVDNPAFDPALQAEGITCAACHVRDGVLVGPTGAPTSAHPTKADPTYGKADFCLRCHQAVATYPGKTFTCTFHTGEEWAAGPYAAAGVQCQTCHMPADGERNGHAWPGGGLGKVAGETPPSLMGFAYDVKLDGFVVVVGVTNANAGHMVPTGDPERFVRVEIAFLDAAGDVVATHEERIGQVWEWWPAPVKKSDNRLHPRERREFRVDVPARAARVRVVASRHRMTEEAAAHHDLLGTYPIAAEAWRTEIEVGSPAP